MESWICEPFSISMVSRVLLDNSRSWEGFENISREFSKFSQDPDVPRRAQLCQIGPSDRHCNRAIFFLTT